jgi:tRNA U34 5-methylaminomethyl-2-thiouridine-forming methyltransferase MnmC
MVQERRRNAPKEGKVVSERKGCGRRRKGLEGVLVDPSC